MSEFSATAASPAEIEARQDELLRQLDDLEKRIARVLADYASCGQSPARSAMNAGGGSSASATSQPPIGAETPAVVLSFAEAAPVVSAATAAG